MKRLFIFVAILSFLLFVVVTLGCQQQSETPPVLAPYQSRAPASAASPTSEPGPQVKGNFIEGVSVGNAETLNWLLATDLTSFSYVAFTLDNLATYDNEWNVVLRHLTKPVGVSEDGLTYTITIRDDLKWSNGTSVTAEDYVYTLKNLMFSDWLNYPYKSEWQEKVNGETIFVQPEVVDKRTFTIRRQTIDPEFIDNVIYSLSPYPKYIASKYEGDVKAFTQAGEFNNLTYTGNLGAYTFKEWIRDDKYVVERNPDYYLGQETGAPYFEQYVTKILGTPAAVHGALEAGDITYAEIDSDHAAKFNQMEKIKVYTVPARGYLLMTYNLRQNGWEGLRNKKVRQALSMSISKITVIESILLGFGDPAFSFIPKSSPWYTGEGIPNYGYGALYDKEKAKQLLYEAGYGIRRPDGTVVVLDKDDKPIKLTLATNSGGKQREDIAFLVKQELADIGIKVDVKLVPFPTLLRRYMMNKVPGTNQEPRYNNGPDAVSDEPWDMIVMGFSTNPIAPSGSGVFFITDSGLNFWGYSNERIDELFRRVKSREALDKEARKNMYAEISQILAEDQPADFLAFPQANHAFQANVKGIDLGMRLDWNFQEWYFADE